MIVQESYAVAEQWCALIDAEHFGFDVQLEPFVVVHFEKYNLLVELFAVHMKYDGYRVDVRRRVGQLARFNVFKRHIPTRHRVQVVKFVRGLVQLQVYGHLVVVIHFEIAQVDVELVVAYLRYFQIFMMIFELLVENVKFDVIITATRAR